MNFFDEACKTSTVKEYFGLYDEPDPAKKPAFIIEEDEGTWIASVNNPNRRQAHFYAIDHCLDLKRDNGEEARKCDGVLQTDIELVFIELKSRGTRKWFTGAVQQLIETIDRYRRDHNIPADRIIAAQACNKLRPKASGQRSTFLAELRREHAIAIRDQAEVNLT